MRDIAPAEKAKREWALSVIRRVYRAHGFDEMEAPALEEYGRLHAGLGGDNEKLSFSVLKRGLTAEDLQRADRPDDLADLGLRFDLTVPLARYYATNHADLPEVFRSVHIGPVWRAERPQKGRYRQFVQADIDIIGDATPLAEAELIAATSAALDALGLRDCVIRLNDRRILFDMLRAAGFADSHSDRALVIIDKLDKIGVSGVMSELRELDAEAAEVLGAELAKLDSGGVALDREAMLAVLPEGIDHGPVAELQHLAALLTHTLPDGVTLVFDPTLVRGMGYYTGTIFEIAHPGSGSSVGGGGRYDGMIGRFLSRDVPAVGFSIGFERIIDLVDGDRAGDHTAVALLWSESDERASVLARKHALLAEGHRVQLTKRRKNMRPVFQRLEEEGFTHVTDVDGDLRELS